MKILVTGANGYLGQGIVCELLNKGHDVIATDISTQHVDRRAIRKNCDLFTIENPYIFFEKPDQLLHLAWRDGFLHYSEAHIFDLPKHYSFVKNMIESDIRMISIMGSMHEIGFFEGSVDENTPCHPENFYGIAKNTLREMTEILTKQNKKKFQWLRGYYIVGNSKLGSSIFSKIVQAVEKGEDKFPFTRGLNQYDFIDYTDFCKKVVAVVDQNKISGVINICNGRPERLADRVERFIKENNYEIKLEYGVYPERPYDSKAIWGDSQKIEKILKENT